VASEVKQLRDADREGDREIGTQIASMQAATQEVGDAIKEITATIGRMSDIATLIAAAVEEQGARHRNLAHVRRRRRHRA